MRKKVLIKPITYLPKQSLDVLSVKSRWAFLKYLLPISFLLIFTVLWFNQILNFIWFLTPFLGFGIAISQSLFANKRQHLYFSQRRVTIKDSLQNDENEVSYVLKSPIYLDVIIKPKKELLQVSFEQYGKHLGTSTIPADSLTGLLDGLSDLLDLEIQDSRSTSKQEDILFLRPVDVRDDIMPSFLKVVDNPLRLIVNPTSNQQNFIINYSRKIIKAADGSIYPLDKINYLKFKINQQKVFVTAAWDKNVISGYNIIDFKTKSYSSVTIKNDLERFTKFLKSKPVLQHIQFEIIT